MSLINDALKKAQRVRHEGPEAAPAPAYTAAVASSAAVPVASSYSRHRQSNTPFLLGVGALLLIGLAVGATLFVGRGPNTPAVATAAAPVAPIPAPAPVQSPPIAATAPVEPPVASSTPSVKPVPIAVTPGPTVSQTPAPAAKPAAVEPALTPQQPPIAPVVQPKVETPAVANVAPAPPKPEERVSKYVDAIRVAGVRSPGPEGRVLMNDRVFKLNDTVDRSLGLKLTKISTNVLTFTDANGVTYEKDF
jgi:hypothetical protein